MNDQFSLTRQQIFQDLTPIKIFVLSGRIQLTIWNNQDFRLFRARYFNELLF